MIAVVVTIRRSSHPRRHCRAVAWSKIACSRREVGPLASKPGKPIKRYASGKFLRLGFETVLAASSRHGKKCLVVPLEPRFNLLGFQRPDRLGSLLVDADDLTFNAAQRDGSCGIERLPDDLAVHF